MAVYKDKERGTWYYQTRITLPDGTVKQKKKRGFKTKKEAQRAEALAVEEVESGPAYTFESVAREYEEWYAARRKLSSIKKTEYLLRVHILPKFGDRNLEDIRPRHIMDYYTEMMESVSAATLSRIHVVMSAVYKFAIKREYVRDNPVQVAGYPEVKESKVINYWTLDEFKQFIKVVDDFQYYTLFMTLYYSGMRKGELLALTWGDIDFTENQINIDKTDYNRTIQTPKTESSIRKLMMPSFVMDLLRRLKLDKDKQFKQKSTYRVFGEFHESIATSTLDRRFERYVKDSGVKKIRLHDFRHSHASYLINKGTVVSLIAKRLGHADVATTLNVYSHLYPSTEKEAILGMEDDFKSASVIKMLP